VRGVAIGKTEQIGQTEQTEQGEQGERGAPRVPREDEVHGFAAG
jgi:hypothetical protein